MSVAAFEIIGKPQAWQRTGGRGSRRYTPAATRDAEQVIAAIARQHIREPLDGPVILDVLFVFAVPASLSEAAANARMGRLHTFKPDRDNLLKTLQDALNGIAYRDDAQVAGGDVRKVWGSTSKTVITVRKGE